MREAAWGLLRGQHAWPARVGRKSKGPARPPLEVEVGPHLPEGRSRGGFTRTVRLLGHTCVRTYVGLYINMFVRARKPESELDPGTPRSRPELRADAQPRSPPGTPIYIILKCSLVIHAAPHLASYPGSGRRLRGVGQLRTVSSRRRLLCPSAASPAPSCSWVSRGPQPPAPPPGRATGARLPASPGLRAPTAGGGCWPPEPACCTPLLLPRSYLRKPP